MTIVPLHHYFRQSHLERVIEQMRTLGAPKIRACHDPVSGAWFALEGTHRLRAAKALGLTPIPVPVKWKRGQKALIRARHAIALRGHTFEVNHAYDHFAG